MINEFLNLIGTSGGAAETLAVAILGSIVASLLVITVDFVLRSLSSILHRKGVK